MQLLQMDTDKNHGKILYELLSKISIYKGELQHINMISQQEDYRASETASESGRDSVISISSTDNFTDTQTPKKKSGLFGIHKTMMPIKRKREICFPILMNTLQIVEKNILCDINALLDAIMENLLTKNKEKIKEDKHDESYRKLKDEVD